LLKTAWGALNRADLRIAHCPPAKKVHPAHIIADYRRQDFAISSDCSKSVCSSLPAALNDPGTDARFCNFPGGYVQSLFSRYAPDLSQEWLGDEVFDTIHPTGGVVPQYRRGWHKQESDVPGCSRPRSFQKLAAIEAGHFVIAEDGVGRIVDHFKQGHPRRWQL